jgi:hypothetical protein
VTIALLIAAAVLLSANVGIRAYRCGKRAEWSACLAAVSEFAEAQAEKEVQQQREFIRRYAKECAVEKHAAEVGPWN